MLGDPVGDIGRDQRQRDLDLRVARLMAQAQGEPADRRRRTAVRRRRCATKVPDACGSENAPVMIAATAKRYRISAVASLASPSPSSTTRIRRGRPSLRAIASGATTSGGATMAPSRKPMRPGQAEQIMRGGGDRAGGEDHAADREQDDRPQIRSELAPAHRDAGRIDQRRQHHQQHQFRRQLDRRHARHEGQRDPGEQQQDRRRDVDPPRQQRGSRQHREQDQEDLKLAFHETNSPGIGGDVNAAITPRMYGPVEAAATRRRKSA